MELDFFHFCCCYECTIYLIYCHFTVIIIIILNSWMTDVVCSVVVPDPFRDRLPLRIPVLCTYMDPGCASLSFLVLCKRECLEAQCPILCFYAFLPSSSYMLLELMEMFFFRWLATSLYRWLYSSGMNLLPCSCRAVFPMQNLVSYKKHE